MGFVLHSRAELLGRVSCPTQSRFGQARGVPGLEAVVACAFCASACSYSGTAESWLRSQCAACVRLFLVSVKTSIERRGGRKQKKFLHPPGPRSLVHHTRLDGALSVLVSTTYRFNLQVAVAKVC